ncbi:MAG: hypothetical protein ACRCSO_03670 [Sphingomonas sp.]
MSINYRRIGLSLAAGIASGLMVAAVPAGASAPGEAGKTTAAPNAEPTAAAPAAKPQRYCINDTVTGSRLPHRTCLTKEEWAAQGVDVTHPDR